MHIRGIEGLRGIAVLAVLAFHIRPTMLPSGFIGVDAFFVISGYVVALATSRISHANLSDFIIEFYKRRALRILPALLSFLLIIELISTLLIPITGRMTVADLTGAAASTGVANIILWLKRDDYFSPGTELNQFAHIWSLGVEEQFYLLFPLFAYFIFRTKDKNTRTKLLVFVAALSIISILIAAYTSKHDPAFAFYMLPSRLWELSVGALLYFVIGTHQNKENQRYTLTLSAVAIALWVFSVLSINPKYFPFPGAIAPVAATILSIYLCVASPHTLLSRSLATPALCYAGRISYSLYLWHWGILVLMRWTIGMDEVSHQLIAAALSFAAAALSFRYIETPTRQGVSISKVSSRAVLASSFAGVFGTGMFIAAMTLSRPYLSLSVTRQADIWASNKIPDFKTCQVSRERTTQPEDRTNYYFTRASCGETQIPGRIYVIGDSHAQAYQRLFASITHHTGIPTLIISKPSCPVLSEPTLRDHCKTFHTAALRQLPRNLGPGDTVFLPGLRSPRYREYSESTFRSIAPTQTHAAEHLAEVHEWVSSILNTGARVLMEMPKPVYRYAPLRCSDRFNALNSHCQVPDISRDEAERWREPAVQAIQGLKDREPRLELWDAFSVLCPGAQCQAMTNGRPIVTDGDHLSGYGNDLLYSSLSTAILMPKPQ